MPIIIYFIKFYFNKNIVCDHLIKDINVNAINKIERF